MAHNQEVIEKASRHASQDLLLTEAAVIVGLISTMTGDALQDDIAATVRALRRRGQDILSRNAALQPQKGAKPRPRRGRNVN